MQLAALIHAPVLFYIMVLAYLPCRIVVTAIILPSIISGYLLGLLLNYVKQYKLSLVVTGFYEGITTILVTINSFKL